ncbi:hypothetical protein NL676_004043 [Syzygium grande]|nr:hypothetical protein NL676_004043 [Syzygium grande]
MSVTDTEYPPHDRHCRSLIEHRSVAIASLARPPQHPSQIHWIKYPRGGSMVATTPRGIPVVAHARHTPYLTLPKPRG